MWGVVCAVAVAAALPHGLFASGGIGMTLSETGVNYVVSTVLPEIEGGTE
jgi:hypothetical protein